MLSRRKKPKTKYLFRIKETVRYWMPVYLMLGVVLYLHLIPGEELRRFDFPFADKIGHILMFMGVSFSFARALTRRKRRTIDWRPYSKSIIRAIVFAGIYGLLLESMHKYLLPNRGFEWMDIVADFTGAVLGAPLIIAYRIIGNKLFGKGYVGRERRPTGKGYQK